MVYRTHHRLPFRRQGAVLPLVTILLVGLLGFVALAIDIGVMTVARTQAQNAADVAALSGARTLNGLSGNNKTASETEAADAATGNKILEATITAGQVASVQTGVYRYDTTSNRFIANFATTPTANEAWGATRVNISTVQPTYFGRVFGVNSLNIGATATAVHRPRDIAVVLDFSGSMKFSSEFNWPRSTQGKVSGLLNPDPLFPRFGPWSIYPIATAGSPNPMQRVDAFVDSGGETHAANNMTIATANGPALVSNFQINTGAASPTNNAFVRGGNLTPAAYDATATPVVTPTPDSWVSQYAASYDGDRWPLKNGVSTTTPGVTDYAKHVAEIMNTTVTGLGTVRDATWEDSGYDLPTLTFANGAFKGYSMGPAYYGKSFYMWPPDPRFNGAGDTYNVSASNPSQDTSGRVLGDWRKRFFRQRSVSSSTPGLRVDNNITLFNTDGTWKDQGVGTTASYVPDYRAILAWLNAGPKVLPTALRAGRVLYYSAIPTDIPVDWSTGQILNSASSDQRFWKEYIDFVLGAGRHGRDDTLAGYGANNTWSGTFGTGKITDRTTLTELVKPYMQYDDCPVHPRAHMWFGPLTMLGFLSVDSDVVDYNWYAGTTYEAQTWQLKAGIQSALQDIKNNHPNDLTELNYFSSHNSYIHPRTKMGKSYDTMKNSLFYPFSLLSSLGTASNEMRPYSNSTPSNGNPGGLGPNNYSANVPNADGGTNPTMGLMIAYNQFNWVGTYNDQSGNSQSYAGRNGASKVVILESDGVANQTCNGTFTAISGGRSHWTNVSNGSGVGNGAATAVDPAITLAWIIAQDAGGSTAWPTSFPSGQTRTRRYTSVSGPGFSTSRNPARVHTLAFGELFEPTTVSSAKTAALRLMLDIQFVGGTSAATDTSIESYKIITGDYNTRINKIRQALERIMQGGVQVALIQ
jgi:Flp pilus assembly protein TadG